MIQAEGSHHPGSPIREYFEGQLAAWQRRSAQDARAGAFVLPLAPDQLHKQNGSGGSPYGMVLPDACADGLLGGETAMPFVSYLNRVSQAGGFPRPTGSQDHWRVTQALARDLLPL